jgi:hypothetical protein
MGLLDEAIRDHLELKRLQGADPEEIARKEREALEPVLPDEPATWGGEPSPAIVEGASEQEGAEPGAPMREGTDHDTAVESQSVPPEAQGADFSTVGQETVEIDMREVLGGDDAFIDAYPVERAGPVRAGRITAVKAVVRDDELEWEVAGGVRGESTQSIPGQERLSFD